jgi:hypothetical protein
VFSCVLSTPCVLFFFVFTSLRCSWAVHPSRSTTAAKAVSTARYLLRTTSCSPRSIHVPSSSASLSLVSWSSMDSNNKKSAQPDSGIALFASLLLCLCSCSVFLCSRVRSCVRGVDCVLFRQTSLSLAISFLSCLSSPLTIVPHGVILFRRHHVFLVLQEAVGATKGLDKRNKVECFSLF